ncbi:MAG: MotA/TolQ/ExbB proton channel family protein [Planctomycetota bacterium]
MSIQMVSDWLDAGGPVLGVILLLSVFAWILIVTKWLQLRHYQRAATNLPDAAADTPAGRIVRELRELAVTIRDRATLTRRMRPAIEREAVHLRQSLPLIASLAAIAPLLGLLGTVTGIMLTFHALSGSKPDGSRLAAGISQALITTRAGLAVALPLFIIHRVLRAHAERQVVALDRAVAHAMAGMIPAPAATTHHPEPAARPRSRNRGMFQSVTRRRHDTPPAVVDIAPLIDVVFILLIFFLVTTTFITDQGIDVSRPDARTATALPDASLRLSIGASGTVYVDGESLPLAAVADRVAQFLRGEPSGSVIVIPDRDVSAGRLVAVIDAARAGGARHVSIAATPVQSVSE